MPGLRANCSMNSLRGLDSTFIGIKCFYCRANKRAICNELDIREDPCETLGYHCFPSVYRLRGVPHYWTRLEEGCHPGKLTSCLLLEVSPLLISDLLVLSILHPDGLGD